MKRKGNVLHYLNYKARYKGNFIPSIVSLDECMKERGFRLFYVFPGDTKQSLAKPWIDELEKAGKPLKFWDLNKTGNLLSFLKLIRKENIRILHLHFYTMKDVVMSRIIKLLCPGLKIILHCHNLPYSKNKIAGFLRKFLYSGCTIIGVSEAVSEVCKSYYPYADVRTVANAIDFSRLQTSDESILSGKDSQIKCLMFGYDFWVKGVDIALKAFENLNKDLPEPKYILYVSISTDVKIARERVIDILGYYPEWIELLTAVSNVSALYNSADNFLAISREEGFCYAAVEAEYSSCQVIATKIPAQNCLVLPTAIRIDVADSEQLAEAIVIASKKKIEKQKILDENRAALEKKYSLDAWGKQIIELYIKNPRRKRNKNKKA